MNLTEKQQVYLKSEGYDLDFLNATQPKGGIKFRERFIETGDGYIACLHLYAFAEEVHTLWLRQILNTKDTVATMDIATANKQQILKDLNRSIGELKDRSENGRNTIERSDAYYEFSNLKDFAFKITQNGEVIKFVHSRIFIYNDSQEKMEQRISEIKRDLSSLNHKTCVLLFQTKSEWLSLFNNLEKQTQELKIGKAPLLPSYSIGGGIPFHHTALKDPRGMYLGQTSTGGPFLFDPFYSTNSRRFFNTFILGLMGYGKSTLMKQIEEGLVARDCYIRGFDKARDYYHLIKEQGGKIIDLGGGEGIINPLEIFATITDVSGKNVDEVGSFTNHLDKVTNLIRFINPQLSYIELAEFKSLLRHFYIGWGLLEKDYDANLENKSKVKVTGLKVNAYPTFSDFFSFLNNVQYKNATPERIRSLEVLKITVEQMVDQYGALFDGISTIENFEDEQIVIFDIDSISQLSKEVFQCQLFNALTIIWNHSLKNGRKMKNLVEDKKISIEEVKYTMVLIDECHNVINTKNIFAVDYITSFQREMRKFYAGITFATQSPNEILGEGSASEENVAAIKTVFDLTQYKFFLNLNTSVLSSLRRVLGDSLTETEFEAIPKLQIGQAIVQIDNTNSFKVHFDVEDEQLERYKGGQ